VKLSAYESIVLCFGAGVVAAAPATLPSGPVGPGIEVNGPWIISTATSRQYPEFEPWRTLNSLSNLCQPGMLPQFSGTIRYQTTVQWSGDGPVELDMGQVFEITEVKVNGQLAGTRICPPYRVMIPQGLPAGNNDTVIEVTNTLVNHVNDGFS